MHSLELTATDPDSFLFCAFLGLPPDPAASFCLHIWHNFNYTRCAFSRGAYFNQQAQLKQVCDAKQRPSSPHNDYRIDRAEVGKVFRNRGGAAVTMLKI